MALKGGQKTKTEEREGIAPRKSSKKPKPWENQEAETDRAVLYGSTTERNPDRERKGIRT